MTTAFDDCLKKGLIKPFPRNQDTVSRELEGATSDLRDARESFEAGKHLWATVQSYYSMFHAARAVLYDHGYRERSHHCIEAFLEKLVNEGRLDHRFADYYAAVRDLRESANYSLSFSRETAALSIRNASDFNDKLRTLVTQR